MKKKLKASSLFYTLIVAVLIAGLSMAFISASSYHDLMVNQLRLQEHLYRNLEAGIQICLEEQHNFPRKEINLFENNSDSVAISKKQWGFFEIGLVNAFDHRIKINQKIQKAFLIGNTPDKICASALYLQDEFKPLVLAGKTEIIGDAYIPKAGISSGSVDGYSYNYDRLIYGEQFHSKEHLPKINNNALKQIKTIDQETTKYSFQASPDSLIQSFFSPTILYEDSEVYIHQQLLKGNIRIKADSLVYISRDTELEDIIIEAPHIIIQEGFEGNIQAIASKTIEVGYQSNLIYPSVLALVPPPNYKDIASINIGKGCSINGLIFTNRNATMKRIPTIDIGSQSIIEGQVYVDAKVNLLGDIKGNITCKSFSLIGQQSTYSNHLLNVSIAVEDRSTHYLMSPVVNGHPTKNDIAKWLP